MTHEFVEIVKEYHKAKLNGLHAVLATVVALDGSSYRKPGVRMLINQNGQITGAVSGGCVENEIIKQSNSVFNTKIAKIITYDGRYRLGCEGILYILIEIFDPSPEMVKTLSNEVQKRNSFTIDSYFSVKPEDTLGSIINFKNGGKFSFCNYNHQINNNLSRFSQILKPIFRLIIIGAEHDTETLCITANNLGWEVIVIVSPSNPKTIDNFLGARELLKINATELNSIEIDHHSAVLFMTHNYARDLQFLIALNNSKNEPIYCGLLGNTQRRENLLNDLIERIDDLDDQFFDIIYGPTGLNIGAVTPQEISLSICAEILSVTRSKEPKSISSKKESINHAISIKHNE